MGRPAAFALGATVLAGIISTIVASWEWMYYQHHRYARGPSGYIVALGVAGALVSFSLAWLINRLDAEADQRRAMR